MSYTIQQSINYAQTYTHYSPLAVGTGNEPAISIANEIQTMITNAPFTWGWNRKEDKADLVTVAGTQDYTVGLTDFSFLEGVSLTDSTGAVFIVNDIYNTRSLGVGDATKNKQGRPNSASIHIVTYGTSIVLRFMGVPNDVYKATLTYQKLIPQMTTLTGATGTWSIPDQYLDIYNNLFLADAMANVDDMKATQYRMRGVAALLAKAEGLNDMQRNLFLEQYWMRQGRPELAGQMKTQQYIQARAT